MDLIDALLAVPRAARDVAVGPTPVDGPPLTGGEQAGRALINLIALGSGGLVGVAKAHEFHRAYDQQNSPKAQVERQVAQTQLEALNDPDPKRAKRNAQNFAGVTPSLGEQLEESASLLDSLNVAAGKQGIKFSFSDGKLSISGEDLPGEEQFYEDVTAAQADAASANANLQSAQSSQRAIVVPRAAGGFQVRLLDIPLYSAGTRAAVDQLSERNAVSPGLTPFLPGGQGGGEAPVGTLPRGSAGAREDERIRDEDRAAGRVPPAQRTQAAGAVVSAQDVLNTIDQIEPLLEASRLGLLGRAKSAGQNSLAMLGLASPERGTYDPGLAQLEYLQSTLAFQDARLNNPDNKISDADVQASRRALGFDSWLSNPEAAKAKLAEVRARVLSRVEAAKAMGAQGSGGAQASQPKGPRSRAIISY